MDRGRRAQRAITRMIVMPYDTESESRNADFLWTSPFGLEGSGAFRRPGSIVRVLRSERWVRCAERAGSEGSFICRCLGQRKPPNRASPRGPPIGGQDRDGASYRCSAPYTLSRFAGLRPGGKHVTGFSGRFALLQIQFLCHLKGKRENRWHWILCHI